MGCAQSSAIDEEAKARMLTPSYYWLAIPDTARSASTRLIVTLGNDEIESQLKRDRMMAKNEIKMLLLGQSSLLPGPARARF